MNINKENYEIYFLDYFEQRLAPEQVAELMVFLEANPGLQPEFDAFEPIVLSPDTSRQPRSFSNLKKPEYKKSGAVDAHNYEEKMVAYLEGDLNEAQKKDVREFIQANPRAGLELNLFRKTFLVPEKIAYSNKSELKKGAVLLLFSRTLLYAGSAAAAILILFGLFSLLKPPAQPLGQEPVSNSGKPVNIEISEPVEPLPEVPSSAPVAVVSSASTEGSPAIAVPIPERVEALNTLSRLNTQTVAVYSAAYPRQAKAMVAKTNHGSEVFEIGPPDQKQPSFAGRFISGLASKLVRNPNPEKKSILELSVEGYNLIADREVEVEKETDAEGNVIAYNIKGESLAFSRKVRKPGLE